jgi:hypothetical protein
MAKYVLENEYGNAIYEVDSERSRDELIKRGFREKKAKEIKRRKVKKNERTEE